MAASDVVVEEFDDLGFTLSDPQIIDRLVSELKSQLLFYVLVYNKLLV